MRYTEVALSLTQSKPPDYAASTLHSLCIHGKPLTVSNRGIFDSSTGRGDLLLAGQLSDQPVENLLNFRALRLEYVADTGLHVTLVSNRGVEQSEQIPASWVHCADDAMELDLPSDAFYLWASVGVKSRHLRLQVAPDDSLILHSAWEEKGMGAIVIPLKFSGDSWARFPPHEPATGEAAAPIAAAYIGACHDLTGTFAVDGVSIRLDGSIDKRDAGSQFFRPEIMGDMGPSAEPAAVALSVAHVADGGIELALLKPDGSSVVRRLEADRVSCESERWTAKGEKDGMSPFMLLMGSAGVSWEDLTLWRDSYGALMVRGIYRSRGALFLIPAGSTSELFVRFELLPDVATQDGNGDDSV